MKRPVVYTLLFAAASMLPTAPAFGRAGYPTFPLAPEGLVPRTPTPPQAPKTPESPQLPEAPKSPAAASPLKKDPPKPRKKKIVVTPAPEPASFSGRFSSVCHQMLSFPAALANGVRSDRYEVAADLAVPREQVSRLVDMGPSEGFRARIVRKFKALLGRAQPAPTEINLVIADIGRPDVDVETKRTLEHVNARLAELQSDSYQKPNSHYFLRHAVHSRKAIDDLLARAREGARLLDERLVAQLPPTPAPPAPEIHVDVTPASTGAEHVAPPVLRADMNFPFNVNWDEVRARGKAMGLGLAAGLGTVFMVNQDPKWLLATMVGSAAGAVAVSRPLRDQLGQFAGWIKSVTGRRAAAPETVEEKLARRLARTREQMAVLEQIQRRMQGVDGETGLSYYSFVGEAEVPHALTQPVLPAGMPPRDFVPAETRLVRTEVIVYTNLNAHRMLWFVSPVDDTAEGFTEVSLVHK